MFEAFGVNWTALLFQVVNFLLLLYLLNRFLFKRVFALLDERQQRISKGLEDAEAAARDREAARAEREAALADARKEAAELLANAQKIAEDSRREITETARAEADKLTERAREEIAGERDRAIADLQKHVAELALAAASKLVKSEMDGATQRRLVDEFLAETPGNGAKAKATAAAGTPSERG
jgi:F-type H+-transporting ATPase subunit b